MAAVGLVGAEAGSLYLPFLLESRKCSLLISEQVSCRGPECAQADSVWLFVSWSFLAGYAAGWGPSTPLLCPPPNQCTGCSEAGSSEPREPGFSVPQQPWELSCRGVEVKYRIQDLGAEV